jgi:hypothetical protein
VKGLPEEKLICREWFSLIRQHNKLRTALQKHQQIKDQIKAEKSFRTNKNKFAAHLFQSEQQNNTPTFSAETAQQYFQDTYRDLNRNHCYAPLPEFERPNLPEQLFSLHCPTKNELCKSVRRKRNAAAPGINALTYVPYKKCQSILIFQAWAEDLEVQRCPFKFGSYLHYSVIKI